MKKILVVDDERDIAEIVCELLADNGYETITAYDGEQAIEMVKKHRPDGLVLDIKMPVIDGIGVIKFIRGTPDLAKTPIVVLTATQFVPDAREQFKNLNVNTWMAKPFEPVELIDAVGKAVGV
jgi:two-component system response regulator VicR